MRTTTALCAGVAAIAIAAFLAGAPTRAVAQQNAAVRIGMSDLGGTVTGPNGPEAGVWVIAETTDLPTKMAKMVVTDDQGRYLLPELPKANYNVWVRGYGLVDSPKVQSAPGKMLDLTAVPAPNAAAAAEYYPAIYWYSMLKVPDKSEFPGTGASGNGINTAMKSQGQYLDMVRTDGCVGCHQLGNKATRTISEALGHFNSGYEGWIRRIQSGQASTNMVNNFDRMGTQRTLKMFSDWTDRIAAGELPASKPQRPQGVERNVVVTVWDWSSPKAYLHDEASTDKRNPTVNANGPLYGAPENSTDFLPFLEPAKNTVGTVKITARDPKTPSTVQDPLLAPSPYWGDEKLWDSQSVVHNPMFDEKGRVWFTARIRPPANPDFCKKGSEHPSAKLFPVETSGRQLAMLEPKSGKFTLIDTCFPTHHLQFGFDANNTLWFSQGGGQSNVVGWLNTKMYEETGDEQKSQGWTALVLDINGNGKRDEYTEPNQPLDPSKDRRVNAAFYGVAPSPADNSIWGSSLGYPGMVIRLDPGSHPPETALAEVYEVPLPGYAPRGMDIDSQGVVWAPLASGHLASFDRRKCKVLNGPTATGKHCPEGWTLYPLPGPQLSNVTDPGSAEASYYTWVDQHDTFGLGKDVPFATGNQNGSLIAFKDGKMVNLVVPYPLGFFAKGMDGRIDDPNGGWKGRGLWSTTGNRTPFHLEGGKGTLPKVVHFQLRPDPLAN
jgi:hypothetical protein